jgi:hypothetical protein
VSKTNKDTSRKTQAQTKDTKESKDILEQVKIILRKD